jgi:hypothetical protein
VRLKKDIEPLDHTQGLGLIENLRPVQYRMKYTKPGGRSAQVRSDRAGSGSYDVFLGSRAAQRLQRHQPEEWTLEYDQFIAPLVKAVQELSAQVKTLQAEVNALKGSRRASWP